MNSLENFENFLETPGIFKRYKKIVEKSQKVTMRVKDKFSESSYDFLKNVCLLFKKKKLKKTQ